jgi:RHS repeat-associated protein
MTLIAVCADSEVPRRRSRFTGKERDAESGNDYFGARYYSSAMGRFMSPDWNSDPEAVPYADYRNPQSLNLCGYLDNNPLRGRDPDGHSHQECVTVTIHNIKTTTCKSVPDLSDLSPLLRAAMGHHGIPHNYSSICRRERHVLGFKKSS